MMDKLSIPSILESKILIVDDNLSNRELLKSVLFSMGIENVITANDGEEALKAMATFIPDLILLDLMMPKIDGFKLCEILRMDPKYSKIPIFIQSALDRNEHKTKGFSLGVTDYVTKPINRDELISRIKIHLQNRALIDSLQKYHKRTSSELSLAREMQTRMLPTPKIISKIEQKYGIHIDSCFRPSSEIGGDFWGVNLEGDDKFLFWIGDFSGHGVSAALNTIRIHTLIKQIEYDENITPSSLLSILNNKLKDLLSIGEYATMFIGIIDNDTLIYSSAAWPSPFAIKGNDVSVINSVGVPLGISKDMEYVDNIIDFKDSSLFLYSDAAIEIWVNETETLDENGLLGVIEDFYSSTKNANVIDFIMKKMNVVDYLVRKLGEIGVVEDDLTLLSISKVHNDSTNKGPKS